MEMNEQRNMTLTRQIRGMPRENTNSKRSLLHYATLSDMNILVISSVSGVLAGALNPLLTVNLSCLDR